MNAIKNKIRSQRGASITFALLLFLVCAVLSSVIIVAATTAAGRMSGLKESDQRYYAATEAAKRLEYLFDEAKIEVTYKQSGATVENSTFNVLSDADSALLREYSLYAAMEEAKKGAGLSITSTTAEGYTCTVTPALEGGLLTFEIKADGGTKNINSGTYALDIVFASNVKNPDLAGSAATKKATVSWKLHSLKKRRATTSAG